jgi:large subunit ribosomal protein L31
MKANIHPEYKEITFQCSCGNVIKVGSTLSNNMTIEVCDKCHPFYSGKQKIIQKGRVEQFRARYEQPRPVAPTPTTPPSLLQKTTKKKTVKKAATTITKKTVATKTTAKKATPSATTTVKPKKTAGEKKTKISAKAEQKKTE